eukprot:COSAG02_NODE_424_length_22575_cov_79.088361_5_plen_37_part_00
MYIPGYSRDGTSRGPSSLELHGAHARTVLGMYRYYS